ncbi:MAG: adenylate kinase [Bacteroidetes bacterium]|nr:adenylate kinase [Bacteroidota bacterium]
MKIILFGAPGVGKGTQAKILATHFNIPHISTGDILRVAIKDETELGKKAEQFMNAGNLVPDEVMFGIVREGLANPNFEKGFILDGYPRTLPQAIELDNIFNDLNFKKPIVINFNVDEQKIINRLNDRLSCKNCSKVFSQKLDNISLNDKCNKCGGDLFQREDDKPETVKRRLKVYSELTEPVKNFYLEKNLLHNIDGDGGIDLIQNKLREQINILTKK